MIDLIRSVRDRVFCMLHPGDTVNVNGIALTLQNASPRMRYVMSKGYETGDASLASQVLSQNDRVLEAGSATGFLAIHCLKHIRVRTHTMVEANAAMLPVIKNNFSLNGLPEPTPIHAAVAAEDGTTSFGVNQNFWSSSTLVRKGEQRVVVPTRSLPSLIADLPEPPTALIMDIEGGEASIPLEHFALFDKIVIETHRKLVGNEPIDALLRFLSDRGYEERGCVGGSFAFARRSAS